MCVICVQVSGFVDTFQQTDEEKCRLHVLHSITELGQLVIGMLSPILPCVVRGRC